MVTIKARREKRRFLAVSCKSWKEDKTRGVRITAISERANS
jgi:hypothetical protein